MRSIGFSRMGMRWPSSEPSDVKGATAHEFPVARGGFIRVMAFVGMIIVVACAKPSYTAPYQAPRLNTSGIRDHSEEQLRAECDRIIATKMAPTGEASLKIEVAPDGKVTSAQITRSSGDERVDDIFGQAAARLQFDPMPGEAVARIKMGYSCAPGTAVATLSVVSG